MIRPCHPVVLLIGPDGDSPYQIVMTGGGPMVGISKKGMKLSKIVILGGRNDFEKFSFAVSRDFIQGCSCIFCG